MKYLIVFLILWCPLTVSSHQETKLKIGDDGAISGLPKQYNTAKFDLKAGVLSVGEKELKLSDNIMSLFPNSSVELFSQARVVPDIKRVKLTLSGSWYHDKEVLPDYLLIQWRNDKAHHKFSILVDLERLRILDVQIRVKEEGGVERHLSIMSNLGDTTKNQDKNKKLRINP